MRGTVRSFLPLSVAAGVGSVPTIGAFLLSLLMAVIVLSPASVAVAQSTEPATPAAAAAAAAAQPSANATRSTETVQVVAQACPSGDAESAECEEVAGVTLGVRVDGAELPGGPITTERSSVVTSASFQAPVDAEVWVTVLDGIPRGYVFPAGSLTVLVADLPEGGCGGEAVCRFLGVQLLPDPYSPSPDPAQPPTDPLETVHAVVRACAPARTFPSYCEDLAGVTLGVEVDGVELPEGPITTEMGGIGTNDASFQAPRDAFVEVSVLDGLPDGYVFAGGTFRAVVFNLPEQGCGGEALCRYLTIVLRPEPLAPVPDPDKAPIIESEASFAFGADDWTGAFEAIDAEVYQREAVAIYAAASEYPSATLTFELDAAGDGQTALTLTGLDDELPGPNQIVISVNGEIVNEGEAAFYDWDPAADEVAWNRWTLYFPSELLQAGENTITIENLTDASAVGEPPYLLLSEAFVNVDVGGVG